MALYGPLGAVPDDDERYNSAERRLLSGAQLKVAQRERPESPVFRGIWPIAPWLRHHGIDVDAAQKIVGACDNATFARPVDFLSFSVEGLAVEYKPRSRVPLLDRECANYRDALGAALRERNMCYRDALAAALRERNLYRGFALLGAVDEARAAIAAGRTPAGAVEYAKWWPGGSQYVAGRAPMVRMVSLPDDALRCVGSCLAPLGLRPDQDATLLKARDYFLDGIDNNYVDGQGLVDWINTHSKAQALVTINPDALDRNISEGEAYYEYLDARAKRLKFYVCGVRQLELVSKGWRAALRRHAAALKTRHDALSPVADDLAWNLEFMNEVRFDHFGPHDDSESDSDDGPGHDYVVNDPRLIIHS